jgi:hypothetical protein
MHEEQSGILDRPARFTRAHLVDEGSTDGSIALGQ